MEKNNKYVNMEMEMISRKKGVDMKMKIGIVITLRRSGRLWVRATARIAGFASLRAVANRFNFAW